MRAYTSAVNDKGMIPLWCGCGWFFLYPFWLCSLEGTTKSRKERFALLFALFFLSFIKPRLYSHSHTHPSLRYTQCPRSFISAFTYSHQSLNRSPQLTLTLTLAHTFTLSLSHTYYNTLTHNHLPSHHTIHQTGGHSR